MWDFIIFILNIFVYTNRSYNLSLYENKWAVSYLDSYIYIYMYLLLALNHFIYNIKPICLTITPKIIE